MKENIIPNFCAGNAICHLITAVWGIGDKAFSFPFHAVLPTDGQKHPFFIHINFRGFVPDRYMPTKELVDNGFSVLSFCYQDVTTDNRDFTDGMAGVLCPDGNRCSTDPGKIAMWAWAAHRVMDYAQTREDVLDLNRATVCGHSRGNRGETLKDICRAFPYWFFENYKAYVDLEWEMPFDQQYLLASVAPRRVLVGSATEDLWADPVSEFLCCAAVGDLSGGFPHRNTLPEAGEAVFGERIGYHLRKGKHYFSRAD